MKYSLSLYYKEKVTYTNEIPSIKKALEKISARWKITIEIMESQRLFKEDTDRLKMEFRAIEPQIRGSIVASKGRPLPLSKGKNLNLENTPILAVVYEGKCIDVYPHRLGTNYYDITTVLKDIFKSGPTNYFRSKGLLEEPIVKILSENPSLLGDGMTFIGSEIDVDSGKPDIVFKDINGRIVIVEVETHADDFAVGQISRGATGYAVKHGLDLKDIRKAIVYQSAKKTLESAALSAGIELYKLELRRLI